jgi:hypothetical protein
VLPPGLTDLSVGALRSVEDGECDEHELMKHIDGFLPDPYQRFRTS